ncbi:MAG TPA: cupin-like domain-containing protein [Phnomibacter sp.]|nr:cupin-like domain-containing protein [Phnomibacter sp.]
MQLCPIDVVENIEYEEFQRNYFKPRKPLIIKGLAKQWPAYTKWNWDYFIELVGKHTVPVYNNVKSDPRTPINKADGYMPFGEYLKMVSQGPVELRVFAFNIFDAAKNLTEDFSFPTHLAKRFVKRYPMLFVGGAGSITHMHFDIDHSHIFHTQFIGRKRVLLFPYEEAPKLYRKPWEVLCMPDYTHYHEEGRLDLNNYPAIKKAKGYEVILEHGDTMFMPTGYFHHMEYIESGFAMSLRLLDPSPIKVAQGVWSLVGMRNIDTLLKKTMPNAWYNYKKGKVMKAAAPYEEA